MRRLRFAAIAAFAALVMSALGVSTSSAGTSRDVGAAAPPPKPPAVALPTPKPVPAMKPLPAGSTDKDFEAAVLQHARASGQAYAVDSSTFDPTRKPAVNGVAADVDVPSYFSYLDLQSCRHRTDTRIHPPGVGRIWNHWQWCGWDTHRTRSREVNNSTVIYTGALYYRLTVIGWGSQSSNDITVRIYADQVSASAESALQPGNSTLVATPSCEFVYYPGTCSFSDTGPSKTFLDLKNGGMIEFTTTVGLPAADNNNLDQRTGLNLGVKLRFISTATIGEEVTLEDLKTVVRCDAATRGGFTKPACIFAGVQPYWSLSRTDPEIGEVAQHIWDAQHYPNNTLPPPYQGTNKIIPSTLSRTTDKQLRDAQRNRAVYQCRKWIVPVPSDDSCDEYPFASTYEGSLNEPENDYSVRAVNAGHNSLEGSRRGTWYTMDRILEGDYFGVYPY